MADGINAFPPSASAPTRLDLDLVNWKQTNENVIIRITEDELKQARKNSNWNFWVEYFKDHQAYVQVVATEDMKATRLGKLLKGDVFARDEKGQEGREGQIGVLMCTKQSRIFRGQAMGTVCFVDDDMKYEDISLERLRKVDRKMEEGEFDYVEDCYLLRSLVRTFEDDENVNVYDLSALEEEHSRVGRRREVIYEFSAVLCALMQIIFPLAVGVFVAAKMTRDPERQFCPITTGWERDQILIRVLNKITGLLSVLYLFLYLMLQQKQWAEKPTLTMLKRGRMAKVIEQPIWILLGRTMTVLNLSFCGFVSLMVIYEAEDPLDLVLNSLALFFVAEVDELLVRRSDVQRCVRLVKESSRKYVKPFKMVTENKRKYPARFKSAIVSATRMMPDKEDTDQLHDFHTAFGLESQNQSEPINNNTDQLAHAYALGARSQSAPEAYTRGNNENMNEIIPADWLKETYPLTLPETAKLDNKISKKYDKYMSRWLMNVGSIIFIFVNIVLVLSPIYIVICK